MLSLGVFVFFFLARFVIGALFVAAILSFVFFLGRKLRNFFHRLDWEEYPQNDRFDHHSRRALKSWLYENDPLTDTLERPVELVSHYRVIKIQ